MNKIFVLLLLFSSLLFSLDTSNWQSGSIQKQIDKENKEVLKGVGSVFVPAMTDPDYEPFYYVYDRFGNSLVSTGIMGQSTYLKPGWYTLKYGSGAKTQMMEQQIQVFAENTTIPDINWAGLTIEIIDENRNSLDTSYELFDKQGESYGIGYGANQELGEKLRTWILPPGRYKIVLGGQSFNTYSNFVTIDVVKGNLTPYSVVLNPESGQLIGAGVLSTDYESRFNTYSKFYSAIHANINISSDNENDAIHPKTNFNLSSQFDNRYTYDNYPYHYSLKVLTEAGFSKNSTEDIYKVSADELSIKNTFTYYFFNFLGIYSRFDLDSHFFEENIYTDDPKDYLLINSNNKIHRIIRQSKKLRVKSPGLPLQLKEGIGANFRIFNNYQANLNFRAGFGLRQDINDNYYAKSSTVFKDYLDYEVYQESKTINQKGLELSLVGNFQVLSNLSYTTSADLLFPFDKGQENNFVWQNIFNLKLIKYVSLDYRADLNYNKENSDYIIFNQSLFLRLTYYIY